MRAPKTKLGVARALAAMSAEDAAEVVGFARELRGIAEGKEAKSAPPKRKATRKPKAKAGARDTAVPSVVPS